MIAEILVKMGFVEIKFDDDATKDRSETEDCLSSESKAQDAEAPSSGSIVRGGFMLETEGGTEPVAD